jgi:hypothetical protein
MLRLRRSPLLASLVLSALGAACADPASSSTTADGAEQETVSAETILEAKLYDDPSAKPDPSCDVHTSLRVSKGPGGLSATLEERLSGECELYVAPNPRTFSVEESESCGSKVYTGAGTTGSVKIEDHRTRLCEDYRPYAIEVEETTAGGAPRYLAGAPVASAEPGPGDASVVVDTKLYVDPHAAPSPTCDHYLKLVVGKEGEKLVASLEYELSNTSSCDLAIQPDPRTYELAKSEESCGSTIYEGTRGADTLRIQDNATRLCEDLRPARFEVSEARSGKPAEYFGK